MVRFPIIHLLLFLTFNKVHGEKNFLYCQYVALKCKSKRKEEGKKQSFSLCHKEGAHVQHNILLDYKLTFF